MEKHPSAQSMVQIGKGYSDLGKPDSALIAFVKAIRINKDFAPAYMRLSHLKKDAGEINEAIAYAKKGMQIDPDNIDYNRLSGLSNEVKSKFKLIKPKTLGQALRIDGVTPAAVIIILSHLKKSKYKASA